MKSKVKKGEPLYSLYSVCVLVKVQSIEETQRSREKSTRTNTHKTKHVQTCWPRFVVDRPLVEVKATTMDSIAVAAALVAAVADL
jgi:hypothetical protein